MKILKRFIESLSAIVAAAMLLMGTVQAADQGSLVFGGNAAYPPITYLESGQPKGVVVDIVRALEERIGKKIDIRLMIWKDAQSLVLEDKIDLMGPMAITEARKPLFDFSRPILDLGVSIFVRKDHPGIKTLADLKGMRVGVAAGGLAYQVGKSASGIHLAVLGDDQVRNFEQLAKGDLDAILADHWNGCYILSVNNISNIQVVGDPVISTQTHFAIKKGKQGLLAEINKGLGSLESDGTLTRIKEKWSSKEVVIETREQVQVKIYVVITLILVILLSSAVVLILLQKQQIALRRMSEEKLNESKSRLQLATNAGKIGIWDWDVANNVLFWDDSMYVLYGINKDDFGGAYEAWSRTLHHDDREFAEAEIQAVLRGEREYSSEFRIIRPDGAVRIVRAVGQTFRDKDGKALRMIGTNVDVTERKEAEEALVESEKKYRQILSTAPIGIFQRRVQGEYLYFNRGLVEQFECQTDDEFLDNYNDIGNRWAEPERLKEFTEILLTKKVAHGFTVRTMLRNGKLKWFSLYVTLDESNSILSGFSLDITERKLAEEELEKYREHLEVMVEERTAELQKARNAADAANQAKSMFLANMSHEIRTPMNAVLGSAQLLKYDNSLSPAARDKVTTIMRSGDHLLDIINDILEMSRIEAGKVEVRVESMDLHSLLDDLAVMFRMRAEQKGLALIHEAPPDLPRSIVTDEGKVRQILINLLGNAIKFTRVGSITLRAILSGSERVAIEVQDSGIGITAEEQMNIFHTFERTRSGEQAASGTGLGLAISQEYAHMLGGDITVNSRVNEGSCFHFEFPLLVNEEEPASVITPRRVTGLASGQGEIRVLIVDDLKGNRDLLREMLEMLGFVVEEASNGYEAIEKSQATQPRIILMDQLMPGMDGIEATRILRKNFGKESLSIIGITANAFREAQQQFLDAGINCFIAKPFREQELYNAFTRHAGVRFEMEETSQLQSAKELPSIKNMPAEWISAFQLALASGNITRIRKLGEEAKGIDPALSVWLLERAETYDIEELSKLITTVA
jgi:PAS domain S-box-containing protein